MNEEVLGIRLIGKDFAYLIVSLNYPNRSRRLGAGWWWGPGRITILHPDSSDRQFRRRRMIHYEL